RAIRRAGRLSPREDPGGLEARRAAGVLRADRVRLVLRLLRDRVVDRSEGARRPLRAGARSRRPPGDPAEYGARHEAGATRIVVVEEDRKSTRLNSSHVAISYAVFCL